MKNILFKIISVVFVLCLFGGAFYGCDSNTDTASAYSYVSMRINPEVELVVDDDNVIVGVNPLNQDAEVLLADVTLVGMTVEEGSELVVQLATEAGYINVDSYNEVYIDVLTDEDDTEGTKADRIAKSMQDRIAKFFDNNGIFGRISKETLDEYLEEAQEMGISAGKLKLMMRALDLNPDLTLDQIKDFEVKEIIALIHGAVKEHDLGYTARQEFKAAREALKIKYENMFALEEEVETIKEQLENFTGTDDEKALLEADLQAKEQEYEAINEQYKTELEDLKEQYEAMAQEIKETRKAEMEQKKQEHKAQIEQHKEKMKKIVEGIVDEMRAAQEELEAAKDRLDEKYDSINELKQDIWTLKVQLENIDLTEEQAARIKADLETKQNELEALQIQYKQELTVITEAFKQKIADLQQQYGQQK